MNEIKVQVPDGKDAKWINNVLTLVDKQPKVEFKFDFDDKVRFKGNYKKLTIYRREAVNGKPHYWLQDEDNVPYPNYSEEDIRPYVEQPEDITERIKTFGDACEWCHKNGKEYLVSNYEEFAITYSASDISAADILAYLKLRIITCALNEGWEPTSKPNEKRWFVDFDINTKRAYFTDEINHVNMPFMLALRYEKLALYAGRQFKDIYLSFYYK